MRRVSSVNFITLPGSSRKKPSKIQLTDPLSEENDLEDDIVKKELNKPVGIVAIHINEINLTRLYKAGIAPAELECGLPIYLRLRVGMQVKCTCTHTVLASERKVVIDEMKNFPITISPKRSCADNLIRIEVIRLTDDDPELHPILVARELHLYEIIKKMRHVKSLKMFHSGELVALAKLEFGFTYGTFGYGYSNQLEDRSKPINERVKYSMYCREDPPASRLDRYHDVMLSRHVGHPSYIHFMHKVNIGVAAQLYPSDILELDCQLEKKPVLLTSKIRKQMNTLYMEYTEQTSRPARVRFLRNLVRDQLSPCSSGISDWKQRQLFDGVNKGQSEAVINQKSRKGFRQQSTREHEELPLVRILRWLFRLIVGCRNCGEAGSQMDVMTSGSAITGGDNSQPLTDTEDVKPGPSGLQHRLRQDYEISSPSVCSSESSDVSSTRRRTINFSKHSPAEVES